MHKKIHPLLKQKQIYPLKRKRCQKISKYKCRLVIDGTNAKIGADAKAEEKSYFELPKDFPDNICIGYHGGTFARLKRNIYGSKLTPRLQCKCLHQL